MTSCALSALLVDKDTAGYRRRHFIKVSQDETGDGGLDCSKLYMYCIICKVMINAQRQLSKIQQKIRANQVVNTRVMQT